VLMRHAPDSRWVDAGHLVAGLLAAQIVSARR